LRALVFLWNLARQFTKDGELHDRYSDLVEADSLGGIGWCDTLGCLLDIWVELKSGEIRSPVLHGRSYDTPLASDRFVAEVIDYVLLTVHLCVSCFDSVLKHVKQF
jgi:hypothetical protein